MGEIQSIKRVEIREFELSPLDNSKILCLAFDSDFIIGLDSKGCGVIPNCHDYQQANCLFTATDQPLAITERFSNNAEQTIVTLECSCLNAEPRFAVYRGNSVGNAFLYKPDESLTSHVLRWNGYPNMMVLKSSSQVIFGGKTNDGPPVIAELRLRKKCPVIIDKTISIDLDIKALFYNRKLDILCVCHARSVSVFDMNYRIIERISREEKFYYWNPNQVTLLDQNILVVKAEKIDVSDLNPREFLHAFKFISNHYEECATLYCSTLDMLSAAQRTSSLRNRCQGLLCRCNREDNSAGDTPNGFQFVAQNAGRLIIVRYEFQ